MAASKRAAARVHHELSKGLPTVATVASVTPLLGLLATAIEIPNSFKGCVGEKSACMAAVFDGISMSMWPAALGLAAGLIAFTFYQYLQSALQRFDTEMRVAVLDVENSRARIRR